MFMTDAKLPDEFKNITGVVEVNFVRFDSMYPNIFIPVREKVNQVVIKEKMTTEEKNKIVLRLMVEKGKLVFLEAGLPESSNWKLEPEYIWDDGTIIRWDRCKFYS